ncbi:Hypothetical predicted protein [Mytilus galloprovincialis]|uniref:Ig-like domain-containing protein n=1 Tax=Mytilus galloprovincialis TaxID=29158 RepID=A0A8B6D5J1_MYTGA|nr:Hypothetical predicted protein [Mytilus galloprovincialis]
MFDLRGLKDESVNGKWSCHHGTNVETASANVSILDKKVYLRLTGPTLIKMSEPVWLKCVSNKPMNTKLVRFYVNNKLYNTLTKRDSGCHSSFNYICRPNTCQCSADGKTYLIKYGGFESGGIFSIECKVDIHTFLEMSDCMMIKVTESPILEIMSTAVCSQSADIKLSCNASGELPVLHFRHWKHSFNGYVIRYLEGKRIANTSILYLDKCNYEDEGDYICSAWTRIENVVLSKNVSSKVAIKGLPIVTEKYIFKEPLLKLSVQIYAEPHPVNVSWFVENVQITNSTSHLLAFSKTLMERKQHGKLIKTIGFLANLTSKNFVNGRKTFCILVQNEIGNASEHFVIGDLEKEEVTGSNVHQYDIPETNLNYEDTESTQNDDHATGQLNEYEEIDKEELHESEDGYEIVHDYMEVL